MAGSYLLFFAGLLGYTAIRTKPEYLGYDWIPVFVVTWPWFPFVSLWLGAIMNAVALYILARFLGFIIGRMR